MFSLRKGEVYVVTERCQDGWFRLVGENNVIICCYIKGISSSELRVKGSINIFSTSLAQITLSSDEQYSFNNPPIFFFQFGYNLTADLAIQRKLSQICFKSDKSDRKSRGLKKIFADYTKHFCYTRCPKFFSVRNI